MKQIQEFNRCVYCFQEIERKTQMVVNTSSGSEYREKKKSDLESDFICPVCGYANGFCALPGWWLSPGTILKGRYVVGKPLEETDTELTYLGWDLKQEKFMEITEYFPKEYLKRDITVSDMASCIPGKEEELEQGRQKFFEKAKLFYQCVSRVETLDMDFFFRNETCYYVRDKEKIEI